MNRVVFKKHNHINQLSCNKVEIDYETIRNNRARLDTGPLCNYDCEFCYYRHRLSEKTSFEVVKSRADRIHRYGIKEIDLSGGESSVSPDWFKILDYCREKFDYISCLSHGGKFANLKFLKKSYEHGLREILFSLHGSNSEVHNSITNRKGSFERIVQAINNAKELGMVVRVNCTVYEKNYKLLPTEYVDLINKLEPLEVNFISLNYWEDVQLKYDKDYISRVDYKDITDHIKKCIDGIQKIKYINVRYTPYCFMQGYEKYVCGQYAHIYDVFDWNKGIYGDDGTEEYLNCTNEEKLIQAHKSAENDRLAFYSKDKECLKCKYFYICDGVENELFKTTKVNPVPGEKIIHVNYFRKNMYDDAK
jgi:radical SAM protein with 4Fe4S-binding SPASM domain